MAILCTHKSRGNFHCGTYSLALFFIDGVTFDVDSKLRKEGVSVVIVIRLIMRPMAVECEAKVGDFEVSCLS